MSTSVSAVIKRWCVYFFYILVQFKISFLNWCAYFSLQTIIVHYEIVSVVGSVLTTNAMAVRREQKWYFLENSGHSFTVPSWAFIVDYIHFSGHSFFYCMASRIISFQILIQFRDLFYFFDLLLHSPLFYFPDSWKTNWYLFHLFPY